jgi:cellulose synthase/poly-beta-1,6-N-acetylglucosamine synthase-like glycosyltransferase
MMPAVDVLLALCAGAAALPGLVLSLQMFAACWPGRTRPPDDMASGGRRPAIAVLIPAHNEERGLGRTIRSVAAQLHEGDRMLVVAHNCSDMTEEIARDLGAEVIACRDVARIGKGYALEAGYRHLVDTGPRELVVIVDADCVLGAQALDHLALVYLQRRCAVQARYVMQADGGAGARSRLSAFAWLVRNDIRPRGYARLGLGCHLMGTGMAIPFAALDPADLATGHVAEDLVLGARLTLAGCPPVFCERATITSDAAPTDAGQQTQKTRWIHGHLLVLRQYAPMLLLAGIRRGNANMIALGADLLVPPLTLLVAVELLMLAMTALAFALTGAALPLGIAVATVLLTGCSLMMAWLVHGREVLRLTDLASLPAHIFAIGRIVAKFVRGERSRWNRSERV